MIYTVHTDGAASVPQQAIGCSYIITSQYDYISSRKIRMNGISNAAYAETIAIGLAAAHLCAAVDLNKRDTVMFNTDSLSALNFCRSYISGEKTKVTIQNSEVIAAIENLKHLASICKVYVQKVKGHKDLKCGISQNIFCDRLCKLALRGR